MEQLLQITTIPIRYELKVQNASLEYQRGTAEIEISRQSGGLLIKSRPIKLHLDTYEARNSFVPTPKKQVQRTAQDGKNAAYEATANFAKEGQIMLKTQIGEGNEALNRILEQRVAMPQGDFELAFLPTTGPNITWEAPQLSIEYQMDKLHFNAKVQKGDIQFIPGDIELSISQYPDIDIRYVGSPIFVPPSAAEHFDGQQIDVQA